MFCDFMTEYIENISAFNITSLLISWSPIQLRDYNLFLSFNGVRVVSGPHGYLHEILRFPFSTCCLLSENCLKEYLDVLMFLMPSSSNHDALVHGVAGRRACSQLPWHAHWIGSLFMEIHLQVIFKFSFFQRNWNWFLQTVYYRHMNPLKFLVHYCPLYLLSSLTKLFPSLACACNLWPGVSHLWRGYQGWDGVALKGQGLKRPLVPSLHTVHWCVPPAAWHWSSV